MNILFLTHRLPYAPNRGDRVRAHHLLRSLASWARVDLVSLVHDAEEASHVDDLASFTSSATVLRVTRRRNLIRSALALASTSPLTHTMLYAPGLRSAVESVARRTRPDLVLCYCTGIGPAVDVPALSGVPLVLDMVDVDSAKWSALSKTAGWPRSWIFAREARALGEFESRLAGRARCTLVVTPRERELLHAFAPSARVEVIPNGVEADLLSRPEGMTQHDDRIVFCGVMDYVPNVEGVLWFVRTVWPVLKAQRPGLQFTIVGSNPAPQIAALAAEPGIEVTGPVPDVRPFLWKSTISIAPLLTARGVQNKVLEAVAAGLPVVITPAVAEGLPEEITPACATAADAAAFAERMEAVLRMPPSQRRAMVSGARISDLSWAKRLGPLEALLREAAGGPPAV